MFRAYGLYSHIRANRLRSAILLAGFVALLHALLFSLLHGLERVLRRHLPGDRGGAGGSSASPGRWP